MRKISSKIAVLSIIGLLLLGISVNSYAANVKVSKIALNKTKIEMKVGGKAQLKATVKPSNASNKKVTFTSSNKKVATVNSNGKITAKTTGQATITVKAKDGSKALAKCKITVKKAEPQGIFKGQSDKNKMFGYRSAVTSRGSKQYKLLNGLDKYAGRVTVDDATKIVKVDGYYCSALGTYFGKVGDKFIVTLDNGKKIKVIMCDEKGNDAPYKKDGETLAHDYSGTKSFLEFYCAGYPTRENGKFVFQEKFAGQVISIKNETQNKLFNK